MEACCNFSETYYERPFTFTAFCFWKPLMQMFEYYDAESYTRSRSITFDFIEPVISLLWVVLCDDEGRVLADLQPLVVNFLR